MKPGAIDRCDDEGRYELTLNEETGLVVLGFDSLNELHLYVEGNHIEIERGRDYLIGFQLGGVAVEISECQTDAEKVIQGLVDSTDGAWKDAVYALAETVRRAAEQL